MKTLHHATAKKALRKGYRAQYGLCKWDEGQLEVVRLSDGYLYGVWGIPLNGHERERVIQLIDEL